MGYAFLLLLLFSVYIWHWSPSVHVVKRVIGISMVELQDGEIIRYIGVDDEVIYPNAVELHRNLVENKRVELEFDILEEDEQGRMWAYLTLDGLMINEWLVANGYTRASFSPPNMKHADRILQMEEEAQRLGIGIWEKEE